MSLIQIESQKVNMTPVAVERVKLLMQEREADGYALRVFVSGGGCSGMQYGMTLDNEPRPGDTKFNFDEVTLLVDPQSIQLLDGATIDYIDDFMGGGFKVENPNAVASCGCGHSFRTEDSSAVPSGNEGGCC
jgi:iron-sulfur cluster assembly accessory protein